jgi:hypothetical protein
MNSNSENSSPNCSEWAYPAATDTKLLCFVDYILVRKVPEQFITFLVQNTVVQNLHHTESSWYFQIVDWSMNAQTIVLTVPSYNPWFSILGPDWTSNWHLLMYLLLVFFQGIASPIIVEIYVTRNSIYISTVSSNHLLHTLLIQFKLVYEMYGQSNRHRSTLVFYPRPARKETNIPLG